MKYNVVYKIISIRESDLVIDNFRNKFYEIITLANEENKYATKKCNEILHRRSSTESICVITKNPE